MPTITALILDVGGVLVKTHDISGRLKWEKRLQLYPGGLAKEIYEKQPGEMATIGKIQDSVIWESIQNKFRLTEGEREQLHRDFFAGDVLNTKFYTYLKQLQPRYPSVILSNAWWNSRDIYTQRYHLDEIVDSMIISAEEGMRKPDPKIFALALQRLQDKKPSEVLFIDDDVANIEAAHALGMHTIRFTNTDTVIEEMEKMISS